MSSASSRSSQFEEQLPNLIIPGAAKAGTTTLYHFLAQHPRIYLPRTKEPHFFSNDLLWERGVEAYVRNHFDRAAGFEVRADATPHYLYYEKAARRIADLLPKSHHRFLVVLRDPVARAYSLYWNMVHEGHEPLSFENALARENDREGIEEIERRGGIRWQYFKSGLYAAQIEQWMRYFARDRFLFLLSDDLLTDPLGTMNGVFRFLGLTPLESLNAAPKNLAARPRSRALQSLLRKPNRVRRALSILMPARWKTVLVEKLLRANRQPFTYPRMQANTEHELRERFASDVERLQSLIGRDLSGWLPPAHGKVRRIDR